MFSRVNKVPNEINKWIIKRIIKKAAILKYDKKKPEHVFNNLIGSQNAPNLKALT